MPSWRERLLRPREGWVGLLLLLVMLVSLAWSVQGAAWLDQLEFLVPVAVIGAIVGTLLALMPLSVVVTLPVGAAVGAWLVISSVGGEYLPTLGGSNLLLGLREELLGWIVVVTRTGYPPQLSPYALGLGALMWTIAFIAAYTVYRHHRVIDAILLVGVAMVANMSATFTDLFGHLVLFCSAALLLWLRGALVSRQESWQRRRVNENLEVPASIMRSGILFAAGSVALAWILTGIAVAAPLTDAWRNLDSVWTEVSDRFEGVVGGMTGEGSRLPGTSFGSGFVVSGSWQSNLEEVMVVAASRPYYLRTVTYDEYTGRGFRRSDSARRQVAPGEPIFPGETPERPLAIDASEIETITVEMRQTIGRNLFTPGFPIKAFVPVVVHDVAGAPLLGGLESANAFAPGEAYQIAAAISDATEAELAGAGDAYPALIRERYLATPGVTDRTRQLARDLVERAGATDPYSQARELARFLSRDASFEYATTAAVPPVGGDLVDFFLFDEQGRRGYCEYYATAMVVMARTLGIPARVAVGYAPGTRQADGTYLVREGNAHAWAELYFPGYGWQIFEATKTINPQFTRQSGGPIATPIPQTGFDPRLFELDEDDGVISTLPSIRPIRGGYDVTTGAGAPDDARGGNALLIMVLVGAALAYVWVRLRRTARRLRFLPAGERAWQRLEIAAGRAGVAPHPSETIYEYAGWLEEQIPSRRPEIREIAAGKVWQAYSGRTLSSSVAARLEEAWQRLRLPFLWLAGRRWLRGLVRRRD